MSDRGVAGVAQILNGRQGAVVLECGACDGDTTLSILRQVEPGRIRRWYCFEADPRNVVKVRRNLENNRVALAPRLDCVSVVPRAVSNRTGSVTMRLSGRVDGTEWTGSSTICKPLDAFAKEFPWMTLAEEVTVPSVSLDEFCAEEHIGHIDLLWVDIEGAERQLIEGATTALAHTDYAFIEVWERPLFEGQWLSADVLAALPGWEMVERIDNNLLMRRK